MTNTADTTTAQEWNSIYSATYADTAQRFATQGRQTVENARNRYAAAVNTNPTPGNIAALTALTDRLAAL